MELPVNQIICGSALDELKKLPDESINCCISSPPYWSLRDYGTATWEGGDAECTHEVGRFKYPVSDKQKSNTGSAGHQARDVCPHCGAKRIDKQLGLEPTFEEYIDKLCTVYDEVKRVLRPDGTIFVNLGDTYGGSGGPGGDYERMYADETAKKMCKLRGNNPNRVLTPKSLCLIPQRFAIEMVNRGWICRNKIIWHKPNPMPSSAKDRFTVDFEQVFFFTKSRKYWFEPQYEPQSPNCHSKGSKLHPPIEDAGIGHKDWHKYTAETWLPLGRNKRCVWTIPTQSCPEAHFATFPDKLVEPMIKAGCPEFVCKKCGKAREKIWENVKVPDRKGRSLTDRYETDRGDSKQHSQRYIVESNPIGYADCGCNAGWRPGVMLDHFCGTGTACAVAAQLGRDYIGIDLKKEYVDKFAVPKTKAVETGVSVAEQKQGQIGLFDSVGQPTEPRKTLDREAFSPQNQRK